MSKVIRLARGGTSKRPHYKIVVTDGSPARSGRLIEHIGTYEPLLKGNDEQRLRIDLDRAAHWIEQGAQPSDRVARFLYAAGLKTKPSLQGTKVQNLKARYVSKGSSFVTRSTGRIKFASNIYSSKKMLVRVVHREELPPSPSVNVSVILDLDDRKALEKLEAGTESFMTFLGYIPAQELSLAE